MKKNLLFVFFATLMMVGIPMVMAYGCGGDSTSTQVVSDPARFQTGLDDFWLLGTWQGKLVAVVIIILLVVFISRFISRMPLKVALGVVGGLGAVFILKLCCILNIGVMLAGVFISALTPPRN